MTACYQEKDCWNFCFSKKNSLFQNLLLLRYTFTISILENKNEQKIVKIEILRTMYVCSKRNNFDMQFFYATAFFCAEND